MALDYSLSADRRLKLRISYIHDQVFQGNRDKLATGLRFRKEFNSFDELIKGLFSKKSSTKISE